MDEQRIKCPSCTERGLRSILQQSVFSTTDMVAHSYIDEDGISHYHDPNEHGRWFDCSNGHKIHVFRPKKVCGCSNMESDLVIRTVPDAR